MDPGTSPLLAKFHKDEKTILVSLRWLLYAGLSYILLFHALDTAIWWQTVVIIALAAVSNLCLMLVPAAVFEKRGFTMVLLVADSALVLSALSTTRFFSGYITIFYFLIMLMATLGKGTKAVFLNGLVFVGVYLLLLLKTHGADILQHADVLLHIPFLAICSIFYGALVEVEHQKQKRSMAGSDAKRVQAEDALKLSAARWKQTFDSMLDGIYLLDASRRIIAWNSTMADLVGCPEEEVIGRTCAELEESWGQLMPACSTQCTASGPGRQSMDLSLNGRHFEVIVDPVRGQDGVDHGSVHILHDITDSTRAAVLLRLNQDRLEVALRGADLGTWDWYIQTDGVIYSERWASMLGYAVKDLVPNIETWDGLMHPEDRARALSLRVDHLAGKTEYFQMEYRLRSRWGRWKWIQARGKVYQWDEDGRPLRLTGTHLDIDEHRTAVAALEVSEASLKKLFDESADGILLVDPATQGLVLGNATMSRMTGYSADELQAFSCHDIYPSEAAPRITALLNEPLKGPPRLLVDVPVKRKDGEVFYTDVNLTGVELDGRALMMGSFRDTSERHMLEKQLRSAQRNEAIGKLAGGIAHDFNNILAVISSFGGFVRDALADGSPARDDIEQVLTAAERAARLTKQLLAFGRRQVVQPVVMDLNEVVSDLEIMLGRVLGEDVELKTVLGHELGLVKADRGQIEQIFLNLAVNARDAMVSGGTLTFETANAQLDTSFFSAHGAAMASGAYVVLSVTDSGVGMTDEVKEHIFEPFFTTKEAGQGTGLGLSTVYGIAQQSEGCVLVRSSLDAGTAFDIYLPRVERSDADKQLGHAAPSSLPGSETILLVEDDVLVRKATQRMLRGAGYSILEASSGAAALKVADDYDGTIALLLTDVVMPQMGGPELVEKIAPTRADMSIMYMSGYTDDAIARQGVLEEGTVLLEKPFTKKVLLQKIRHAIDSDTPQG